VRFVDKRNPAAKVSEWTSGNLPARSTLVQLLALYTDPESHNAPHRYRDGQTDDIMMPIADHTVRQYDLLNSKYP